MQVEAFQEQHREEQPRLIAGQPSADPAPGLGLARGEGDGPAADVRIAADLVGVGVVPVVLGRPPP